MVVVEDGGVLDAVRAEVLGAGWELRGPAKPTQPGPTAAVGVDVRGMTEAVSGGAGTVSEIVVAGRDHAQTAVLLALAGVGLLVWATAERVVVDDLIDDLARIGSVRLIDRAGAISLDADTWRLLHALTDGSTVSLAARALHMSTRTAHRRITDARAAAGVRTRAQLLRTLTGPGRIPPARSS